MIQFNRNTKPENFTFFIQKGATDKTLQFAIRQKATTASEINEIIKKFAEDNLLDELDSNTLQLVTEELVIMILLPLTPLGMTLEYMIEYNRKSHTLTMGMGYPGGSYNPFDMEDNIFMINIFKEWITDIQFSNSDNLFNELFLTIKATQTGSELDDLISEEPVSIPAIENKPQVIEAKSIFDVEAGKSKRNSAPAGEVVEGIRDSTIHILELLIREKGISTNILYASIDSFVSPIDLHKKLTVFDNSPIQSVGAIKSICRVILNDLINHYSKEKKHFEFKLLYLPNDNELILQLCYPGEEYHPFLQNEEDRGIKVISRQSCVNSLHTYKNGKNKLVVTIAIEDSI